MGGVDFGSNHALTWAAPASSNTGDQPTDRGCASQGAHEMRS